jgi:hypothetical protein
MAVEAVPFHRKAHLDSPHSEAICPFPQPLASAEAKAAASQQDSPRTSIIDCRPGIEITPSHHGGTKMVTYRVYADTAILVQRRAESLVKRTAGGLEQAKGT